ncbi:MAG TPA: DUF4192 domain-containing protein [Actinoplanes sp.]|nr:DUF4192 domain-containing protein [Actinoplanes sp.]
MTPDAPLTVSSPADLIAAVPYLLGFHPADSLTVIAVQDGRVVFVARHDLPDPAIAPDLAEVQTRHVASIVARQGADAAWVVGHGTADRVTPAATLLGADLERLGVPVIDVLRVTDGRYFSYVCTEPACCPPEGMPIDTASSVVAAAATYAGCVALPDRESLAAQVDPVTGPERAAMRAATEVAHNRMIALLAVDGAGAAEPAAAAIGRALLRAGRTAVRSAFRRYRAGRQLDDVEIAWLGTLLAHVPVRDYAWERIGDDDWQLQLWADVVRRVEAVHLPAPACLLAFAAWRCGQGALAAVAVERARSQDPGYSMAVLLDEVLRSALPPSVVADWPSRSRPAPPPCPELFPRGIR